MFFNNRNNRSNEVYVIVLIWFKWFNDDLCWILTFAVLWRIDGLVRIRRVARLANLTARARRIVATLLAHSATRKILELSIENSKDFEIFKIPSKIKIGKKKWLAKISCSLADVAKCLVTGTCCPRAPAAFANDEVGAKNGQLLFFGKVFLELFSRKLKSKYFRILKLNFSKAKLCFTHLRIDYSKKNFYLWFPDILKSVSLNLHLLVCRLQLQTKKFNSIKNLSIVHSRGKLHIVNRGYLNDWHCRRCRSKLRPC